MHTIKLNGVMTRRMHTIKLNGVVTRRMHTIELNGIVKEDAHNRAKWSSEGGCTQSSYMK